MRTIRTQRFVRGGNATSNTTAENNIPKKGLAPFISEVCRGRMPTHTTRSIEIKGYHFTPDVRITLKDQNGNDVPKSGFYPRIGRINFIHPGHIEAVVSSGVVEGRFTVVVNNGELNSGLTGNEGIVVLNPQWVDLRTASILDLGLEITTGVSVSQDSDKGLQATSNIGEFEGAIKFSGFRWKRCDDLSFSIVFTLQETVGTGLLGMGSTTINVQNLGPVPLFEAESQVLVINGTANQMYGGGSRYRRWNQEIGSTVSFETSKFYKLNYNFSSVRTLMTLSEVDTQNFDRNILFLRQWFSDSPSDSENLLPYWTVGSSQNLFLTAFKIG